MILVYHGDILNLIWARPASYWILWLWYVTSWVLSLCLVGLSAVFSYLISQVLFSVLIMDHMSRITEIMKRGRALEPEKVPILRLLGYLVMQEIPRTVIPVVLSIVLMIVGWLTPLGPVIMVLSSGLAAVFLAWDNTDLIPARQMVPFRTRFGLLLRTLWFHLGFGLPFLIPVLNILLLSFAPVGATLYHVDRDSARSAGPGLKDSGAALTSTAL